MNQSAQQCARDRAEGIEELTPAQELEFAERSSPYLVPKRPSRLVAVERQASLRLRLRSIGAAFTGSDLPGDRIVSAAHISGSSFLLAKANGPSRPSIYHSEIPNHDPRCA